MKAKIFVLCGVLVMSITTFAQWTGQWYGVISRAGNPDREIVFHIAKHDNAFELLVDFPSLNKVSIVPSFIDVHDDNLSIILADPQVGVEASLSKNKDELSAKAIYGGKPFAFTLTKKRISPVATEVKQERSREGEDGGLAPDPQSPRRIESGKSLFIEELTWMDVRDAMQQGKTTVIIATGGVEQSGPYIVTGKHNYILKLVTESLAKKLGNALIAPIVPFVPEGNFNPPSGHVSYPGTISLREETYEALLEDMITGYFIQGFQSVILIGDSGGNQWGMYVAAKKLNAKWREKTREVIYVPEYYDNKRLSSWLKDKGIEEKNEGLHDNFKVTAQLAALNPELVRSAERVKAGNFSINAISLTPLETTISWGQKIVDYQTDIIVDVIRKNKLSK